MAAVHHLISLLMKAERGAPGLLFFLLELGAGCLAALIRQLFSEELRREHTCASCAPLS